MNLKRKNIQMSEELATWYEDKAEQMGLSQSALMVLALNEYVEKNRAINMFGQMKGMLDDMENLRERLEKSKGKE